jgi:predicted nuclease of predicted toxin-antitoxin system
MRFLLDEDVHPRTAEAAWQAGVDATSVHDVGRRGLSDYEQLRRAGQEARIFVTRNREDYIRWTAELFRAGEPHAGLLILPRGLPNDHPETIASVLRRWAHAHADRVPEPYCIDFVVR